MSRRSRRAEDEPGDRHRRRRCRASGLPSRSKQLRERPTTFWPGPARGRKSSSPISARRPISPRARRFAKNFFEAGGIEAVAAMTAHGSRRYARGLQDRRHASSPACARPTRSMRETRRRPSRALKAAGARHIYLAGRPGEREAALRGGRRAILHLRGLRRAGDTDRRLRYSGRQNG